jgi:hypothetical protein
MPGLVPGIHVFLQLTANRTWVAGTSPPMTTNFAAREVLVRHCADGKTPLLTERLCKAGFGCHNAFHQEQIPCTPPTVHTLTCIPRV